MSQQAADLRDQLGKRRYVLEALSEGPRTKPELVAAVDKSRSTIDRAITAFRDHDCVEPAGKGRYRVTKTGATALSVYSDYVTRTSALSDATALINDSELDIGIGFLDGLDVSVADPQVPELALEPSTRIVGDASQLRGLAAAMLSSYPEILLEEVREAGLDVEIITTHQLAKSALELKPQAMSTLLSYDRVELRITDQPVPESLWIATTPKETHAGITVHADNGVKGVMINNTPAAVTWAERTYAEFQDSSEPLADSVVETVVDQ
ncbi:putative transcriptional regulator [Halohasta litchfieldiae]|jgi:predicted transcriptional regulator|uniref:Predicted transcriptional regulator, contains HTH domain n=1 Tax=Halohasta litchfieldiae TaxID=1073996 RepID=A0A1H6RNE7_9EURY|nr:ArsR family transcriptional regulator [Halohasta litchfieldiae]ATW89750.1 putative transcriptional regulator [Halohasta litchfieldiae]SEI53340.1 Predicted transcriptional regulator, contains HTH domain [Halohasta litchfieldiae]